jgi:hypothetical protein
MGMIFGGDLEGGWPGVDPEERMRREYRKDKLVDLPEVVTFIKVSQTALAIPITGGSERMMFGLSGDGLRLEILINSADTTHLQVYKFNKRVTNVILEGGKLFRKLLIDFSEDIKDPQQLKDSMDGYMRDNSN